MKKLIDLSQYLLEQSKKLTQEKELKKDKNDELTSDNIMLKDKLGNLPLFADLMKIDSTANQLLRREAEVENLIEKMGLLEFKLNTKEVENRNIEHQMKQEIKEKEELEEILNKSPREFEKYTVATSDKSSPNVYHPKRASTFNAGIPLEMPLDLNEELIKRIIMITKKLLESIERHSEKIEYLSKVFQEIDKDVEQIEKEQVIIKQNQNFQLTIIDNNYQDFESHKKVLEQLVEENNDLQNEFRILKRVDLAAIKQHMVMRSNLSEMPQVQPNFSTVKKRLSQDKVGLKIEQSLNS
jgi:hypothetical protein